MPISEAEWKKSKARRETLESRVLEFLRENNNLAFNLEEISLGVEIPKGEPFVRRVLLLMEVRDALTALVRAKKIRVRTIPKGRRSISYYKSV
jgi:hypothetical protein